LNAELAISPRDPLTFAALGQIALVRRQSDLAIELLKKAVTYGPSFPEGFLYLGQAYFDAGQRDPAEAALRTCIRLTRDESRNRYQVQKAHYLLGRILAQQGKLDNAHAELALSRELANKALALDKTRLAGVMETAHPAQLDVQLPQADDAEDANAGHDEKAQQDARKLENELRPALADAFNNLGALVAGRNDYASAAQDFQAAAQWNPQLEGLDYNWGRAAFAANLYAQAIPPLTRYVAAHPNDEGAHSVLAISRFRTDDFQGCLDALQGIAIDDNQAPQIRYIYAVSLVRTGRRDDGLIRLRALARQFPDVAEIQASVAQAEQSGSR
jgi:tetratricopeptide (TPR) repeat protein